MTQLLDRKQTLAAYARDRLGVGTVRVAGAAAPDPGPAAEVLAIRDRLVSTAAKAAESEVEAEARLREVSSRADLIRAELSLEEIEEERAARQADRQRERAARQEQQELSTVALVRQLLDRPDSGETAALRAELERLREERTGQQLEALQRQNEELRAEIRATSLRVAGASSADSVVEEFERILALRERMEGLFGASAPTQTVTDLSILEAQHRHRVELLELEHRIRVEGSRLHLEERRFEEERADRTRRGDQLDGILEQVAPALEQALDQFAASRMAGTAPAAPTPLYPLPLPTQTAAPPPDVDSGPCPSCGATVLMHRSQDTAICSSCMFPVQRPPTTPDEPDVSAEAPRDAPAVAHSV